MDTKTTDKQTIKSATSNQPLKRQGRKLTCSNNDGTPISKFSQKILSKDQTVLYLKKLAKRNIQIIWELNKFFY